MDLTALFSSPPRAGLTKTLRIMRLTAIFIVAACLQSQAKGFSQTVTLSEKNAPMEKVLKDIKRQTGYNFLYEVDLLQKAAPVDLEVRNAPLETVLAQCFANQPFSYTIAGKVIVLSRKEPATTVLQSVDTTHAPPSLIAELRGVITSENGEPLAGAAVEIRGGKMGTFTNEKGVFVLRNVPSVAVLEITFTGYQKREVDVKDIPSSPIILKVATGILDQVQIIAYGTTTERLNTGDVSSVSSKEIEDQPISNPLEAIEGRVPGMFITQGNGMPGSSFTVQIRGQNSIINGNDPLYVIDGVPYTSELLTNVNPAGGSPFNFLNPSDIERIDVLKDADATAIYGSRGANGVVLITTKRGHSGRSVVNANVYSGVGQVPHMMDLMNTQQYLIMRHEALDNDGVAPSLANGDYDLLQWDTTRNTNWQKQLIGGTAHFINAQTSISGGSDNTQYLLSTNYNRSTTVFPDAFFDQKMGAHIDLTTATPNKKFKVQFVANYLAENNDLPRTDPTGAATNLAPDAPAIYSPDGTLNWANNQSGSQTWTNPYASMRATYLSQTYNLIVNSTLSYQIIPGLNVKANLGYTNMQISETAPGYLESGDPTISNLTSSSLFTNNSIRSYIAEPQVNYIMKLGKGHLNALAGLSFEESTSTGQILDGEGYTSDLFILDLQAAPTISTLVYSSAVYKYDAVYGRLNYNWDDTYLIDLTGRRDGSSRFGPGNQFSNFGAVGVGWIFSNEKIVKNLIPALSFGKLRGSYGTTGNDQIGDYRFLNLYSVGGDPYEGTASLTPSSLYNPNLAWEVNKKLQGAIELGFFKDRILVTIGYFRNRSSNQLLNEPLPSLTGFNSISRNLPALVQNKGIEYSLNTTNINTKRFQWRTSFNISFSANKLLSFPNLINSPYANSLVVGQPVNTQLVFHSIGVNDTTGVYQFVDSKGTPTYNPSFTTDRTANININPKFYGGLMNTLKYKSFQLNIFFQFVKKTGQNNLYGLNEPPGFEGYNQLTANLNRWQTPGDKKNIQQFTETFSNAFLGWNYATYPNSDLGFTDASYLRLKNISISYSLPGATLNRLGIQTCRIYLQGENLFTLTHHYLGFDPETESPQHLPILRILTAGIQLSL
jgi:TonB-linked SusC/RagA family outer membrane protein